MKTTKVSRFAGLDEKFERIAAVEARLPQIDAESRGIVRDPLPKAEVTANLVATLRERRERFSAAPSGARRLLYEDARAKVARTWSDPDRVAEAVDLLCWLIGPEIEDRARAAVERLTYAEGAPSAEREVRVAKLAAERVELVAEHERTVDEILAVGVSAEHLPETRQRHAAEAERNRAEANLRVNQQRAAAILDAAEAQAASVLLVKR